ncbi:MAG: polyribonucleotide nucleotidyltransferase [Chloroflexi bacterium RBG_16_52_11]|nr:MAG: polyribonucleotide nucleotidyltransferase [Chloroflexi bacterium RBG_16_52_11]
MKPTSNTFQSSIGTKTIYFETGKLAGQAGGAVTVRLGDTIIFAAATMSMDTRPDIDFFPLTVDYEERMYAGGRIPGSFFRREGRPTEEAILTARLTDRPIRPLFPKDLRNDIQVILYSFSTDGENPIDVLAVNAASAALMISDIPWGGPVGAVRVGRIEGEFILNPTFADLEYSDLDLRLAGTSDAIIMVECGANEVPEQVIVDAMQFGHEAIRVLTAMQEEMAAQIGKAKRDYEPFSIDEKLVDSIATRITAPLNEILNQPYLKAQQNIATDSLKNEVLSDLTSADDSLRSSAHSAYEAAVKTIVRKRILENGLRPDGRGVTDIRPIWCEINVSPRAHGSGLFTRGETQVLTLATLGTPREAQEIDSLSPSESKRYMHHYNFPPFSTGEVKGLRGASRRDIGHGALAERALVPVIPPEHEFPYTLRLVSEVLSSNGSSSMASVCGSTLALMDTGVPIKAPVAGVAMGLIKEGEQYTILTDILGSEDHLGDMDFKVAGTSEGITALQMDIKIKGIKAEIITMALEQARQARLVILNKMLETIPQPNSDLKPHAPRITIVRIPVDKIGIVIGPGGKTIRSIQEETGAKIDIGEDGSVYIASADGESSRKAVERVEALTETPVIGRIYTGRVVRITDFGAFVEILPNIDGMVHISQLDSVRVERVADVVQIGDEITVMVTGIDDQGKIRLSRQAVLEGWTADEAQQRDRRGGSRPPGGGGRSGGSRYDRRDDRRGGSGGGQRG